MYPMYANTSNNTPLYTHISLYSRGTKSLAFLVSQWDKNSILPTLKASREIKK